MDLIYNNPDPSKGGIPRYSYEIAKGMNNKIEGLNEVDLTEVYSDSTIEKLLGLFKRKGLIEEKINNDGGLNHFLQPEIFYDVSPDPNIITVHDFILFDSVLDASSLYEIGRKMLLRRRMLNTINKGDYFIAVSKQTKHELEEYGVSPHNIRVINHGIDSKFSMENRWRTRSNNVGYLSTFVPRKRAGKMCEDWVNSNMEGWKLKVGGWGGSRAKKLLNKYDGMSGIDFLKRIDEDKLNFFYNNLKAFFLPSSMEGFGFTLLEATACGTPAFVYSDSNIPPEVMKYCWKVDSMEEIPSLLKTISEGKVVRNSKRVQEEFNWSDTIRETLNYYKEIEEREQCARRLSYLNQYS